MGFLNRKQILVTGLLSKRSIAYGIAKICHREGAKIAFTYVDERFKNRLINFAAEFDSNIVIPCNVSDDAQIISAFTELSNSWDKLDGLVHSISFAPSQAISGDFLTGFSRDAFRMTNEISVYSFPAMVKAALPLMCGQNASVITLSYLGAERALINYNMMGLAKAALESSIRYLASSIGPNNIRVNGISAGPIKTLAASGIKDFPLMLKSVEANAPLRRNITLEEIGNTAAFLLSDLSSGITGEIIHVDAGFSTIIQN